jgi:hypothetical protein
VIDLPGTDFLFFACFERGFLAVFFGIVFHLIDIRRKNQAMKCGVPIKEMLMKV